MANKHSAFDIYGDNPFIRGAALISGIDVASLPSWTTATSYTALDTFDVSTFGITAGDFLVARWNLSYTTTAGSQPLGVKLGVYDGNSIQYSSAFTVTPAGASNNYLCIEATVAVIENSAAPTTDQLVCSIAADYYEGATLTRVGGGVSLIGTAAGYPLQDIRLYAQQAGTGDSIALWSGYCQLLGGAV